MRTYKFDKVTYTAEVITDASGDQRQFFVTEWPPRVENPDGLEIAFPDWNVGEINEGNLVDFAVQGSFSLVAIEEHMIRELAVDGPKPDPDNLLQDTIFPDTSKSNIWTFLDLVTSEAVTPPGVYPSVDAPAGYGAMYLSNTPSGNRVKVLQQNISLEVDATYSLEFGFYKPAYVAMVMPTTTGITQVAAIYTDPEGNTTEMSSEELGFVTSMGSSMFGSMRVEFVAGIASLPYLPLVASGDGQGGATMVWGFSLKKM